MSGWLRDLFGPAPQVDEVKEAVDAYAAALRALPGDGSTVTDADLLKVLVARDQVARAVASGKSLSAEQCQRLAESDGLLKGRAGEIDVITQGGRLEAWRQSVQPAATAWWWSLDQEVATQSPVTPLCAVLTIVIVAATASLMTDVGTKLLSGKLDRLTLAVSGGQALLVALAGGSLTKTGARIGAELLSRVRAPLFLAPAVPVVIAAVAFVFVWALSASLPSIARWWYFLDGFQLQQAGQINRSIERYQKAVSLDSNFHAAHYQLGVAHETTSDFDKAVSEFQLAQRIRPDDKSTYTRTRQIMQWRESFVSPAESRQKASQKGSAFLFRQDDTENDLIFNVIVKMTFLLLERGDFGAALIPIEDQLDELGCFTVKPADYPGLADYRNTAVACYLLFVSRGWANLGLKNLKSAESDLNKAIDLLKSTRFGQGAAQEAGREEGIGPYCLLAQVVEARDGKGTVTDQSRPLWAKCAVNQRISEEGYSWRWLELAHDRTVP